MAEFSSLPLQWSPWGKVVEAFRALRALQPETLAWDFAPATRQGHVTVRVGAIVRIFSLSWFAN